MFSILAPFRSLSDSTFTGGFFHENRHEGNRGQGHGLRSLRLLPALLTGVSLGFSYPPFPFPSLAWVALVPLLWRLDARRPGWTVFVESYLAFSISFLVAFHWPLFHEFPLTALLSAGGLIALPLQMAVPCVLTHALLRRAGSFAAAFAFPVFWLAMEYLQRITPLGFPWALLGHTQALFDPFAQMVDLAGVDLLSLWVLALNLCVLGLISASRPRHRKWWSLIICLLIGGGYSYGQRALSLLPRPSSSIEIGLVQPGISASEWARHEPQKNIPVLRRLTDSLLQASDRMPAFVVWPETSFRVPWKKAGVVLPTSYPGVPVLTGAVLEATDPAGRNTYWNSVLLLAPDLVFRQDKMHLVPFAEVVPGAGRYPWLRFLAVPAGGVAGYERGSGVVLMNVDATAFGTLICFETIFGNRSRQMVEEGAALLVAVTQDGWWGPSLGHRQHFAFTRLRAIETRRSLVQTSVSGITGIIFPDGSSRVLGDWMERKATTVTVPTGGPLTPYTRSGDWLGRLATYLAGLLIIVLLLMRRGVATRHPST